MEQKYAQVRKYLTNPIAVNVASKPLDLETAKRIAAEKAREQSPDAMLLSWYDGKTGEAVPKAECGFGDKPGWITFAESRGGTLTIDINAGEYIFMYKPL